MKLSLAKFIAVIVVAVACVVVFYAAKSRMENAMLRKIIERLTADSRVAEVVVTKVEQDPVTGKTFTSIKFQEYDTKLKPLAPKSFRFSGNLIQFQSMVIRFDDFYVKRGDLLRGKSAYLFMKAFMLTDSGAEVYDITRINTVPDGYEVAGFRSKFEQSLWKKFWKYALSPEEAGKRGIKNAQIEAPGTKFIPGMIYTIKIEHDGGLRIDARPIDPILRNVR